LRASCLWTAQSCERSALHLLPEFWPQTRTILGITSTCPNLCSKEIDKGAVMMTLSWTVRTPIRKQPPRFSKLRCVHSIWAKIQGSFWLWPIWLSSWKANKARLSTTFSSISLRISPPNKWLLWTKFWTFLKFFPPAWLTQLLTKAQFRTILHSN